MLAAMRPKLFEFHTSLEEALEKLVEDDSKDSRESDSSDLSESSLVEMGENNNHRASGGVHMPSSQKGSLTLGSMNVSNHIHVSNHNHSSQVGHKRHRSKSVTETAVVMNFKGEVARLAYIMIALLVVVIAMLAMLVLEIRDLNSKLLK
jgi:hypothetical protein